MQNKTLHNYIKNQVFHSLQDKEIARKNALNSAFPLPSLSLYLRSFEIFTDVRIMIMKQPLFENRKFENNIL